MKNEIRAQGRLICGGRPPFIVAEMSGNHNQSLSRALEIVDAAAEAGADALKLQTYTADTMTLDIRRNEFMISDPKSLWRGKSLYELYQQAYTPWDWHGKIFDRCKKHGILGFSTPFDLTAVDFLESLGAPIYKIASFENSDIPLVRRAAATGKPVVISTGTAMLEEMEETVAAARQAGCEDLILLKCVTCYPADPASMNLATIPFLREHFECPVGLSDHTLGIGVGIAAGALGACMIEKHFTLSRKDDGVDAAFSLEPAELKALVRETASAWKSIGTVQRAFDEAEKPYRVFRRSLYVVRDLRAGDRLTAENIRAIRPGRGLEPKHYDRLIGRKVKKNVERGTPLSWDLLE